MNEYNKDIGNRIRELRELSDITIHEIADELKIRLCYNIIYYNGKSIRNNKVFMNERIQQRYWK